MARIFTAGAEEGPHGLSKIWTVSGSAEINSSIVRTGNYAYFTPSYSNTLVRNFATLTELYFGFALRPITGYSSMSYNYLKILPCDIRLSVYTDGTTNWGRGTTILGNSGTITLNEWHYIEGHLVIHDSTGVLQVKVDGSLALDLSSQDTSTGTANATSITLGGGLSVGGYWDDIVINDTTTSYNNSWPDMVKLLPVRPTPGEAAQFTRDGWDYGHNAQQVMMPNDGLSVFSNTNNQYDLHKFGALDLPVGATIKNVINNLIARKGTGAFNLAPMIKEGSTETEGSALTVGADWSLVQQAYPTCPSTGVAWVEADLQDTLQLGYKCKSA